jgi:hypothetical protein
MEFNSRITEEFLPLPEDTHKPESAIKSVMDCLLPYAIPGHMPPGRQLPDTLNGESTLWLIISGGLSLYRMSDGLHMGVSVAPQIIGLQNLFTHLRRYHIRVSKDATFYAIPMSRVRTCFDNAHLWKEVAEVMAYFVRLMAYRDEHLVHGEHYQIVRAKILEYAISRAIHVQERMGLARYIQSSTFLSRSYIYRVLFKLINTGCIDVYRGKLVKVNHLPTHLSLV